MRGWASSGSAASSFAAVRATTLRVLGETEIPSDVVPRNKIVSRCFCSGDIIGIFVRFDQLFPEIGPNEYQIRAIASPCDGYGSGFGGGECFVPVFSGFSCPDLLRRHERILSSNVRHEWPESAGLPMQCHRQARQEICQVRGFVALEVGR